MVEPKIRVDKWGCPEFLVIFNREEYDQAFKDCGIEVVDAIERKVIQANGNYSGDGSHVQEGLGW